MLLVQTKLDLIEYAAMTEQESELLAKSLQIPLFRVCSKDGLMINELFEFLAIRYFSKNLHKLEGHAPITSIHDIKKQGAISRQPDQSST